MRKGVIYDKDKKERKESIQENQAGNFSKEEGKIEKR